MEHCLAQEENHLVAQLGALSLQRQQRAQQRRGHGGGKMHHKLHQLLESCHVLQCEGRLRTGGSCD